MRVYFDNCCYNRPFDDHGQVRIRLEAEAKESIQDRIKSGEIELAWSYMVDFENESNPVEERKENIAQWREVASCDVSEASELLSQAERLRDLGFEPKDALHLACAITAECDFFFTTDDGIIQKRTKVTQVRILNPVAFIVEDY